LLAGVDFDSWRLLVVVLIYEFICLLFF
jgi:hypothetical protein